MWQRVYDILISMKLIQGFEESSTLGTCKAFSFLDFSSLSAKYSRVKCTRLLVENCSEDAQNPHKDISPLEIVSNSPI